MKYTKELKGLSTEDLKKRLVELKKELLKLNVQVATGSNPENPGMLRLIKKNIARILTLLKMKEDSS
jgi:large subunit ribosomal protein L29